MVTKKDAGVISIPALKLESLKLKIVGDSPLISHAWSEKAKLMMLQKQQKNATSAKEIRRPSVEFADSLYWLTEKPNLDEEATVGRAGENDGNFARRLKGD